tara:strand:- start:3229 stop:3600 length:372 start_codon:yes stop_codon:yes gene_type:complete
MTEKTYNLKLTAKELYHLQWGIECLRDNFEEGTDFYNDSKKVVENLEKRFEKEDYSEICWGKKTNEKLKKKIAVLERQIQYLMKKRLSVCLCNDCWDKNELISENINKDFKDIDKKIMYPLLH